jgi:predicted nucleic acid-binding protein
MKAAVLADTGPLYAALDPTDQYHRRAQAELKILSQARLDVIIAYPTLFETYSLILYRLGVRSSLAWRREIQAGSTLVAPTLEDYHAAEEKLRKYVDQTITLYDALVSVLANRAKIPVWTYDHHFDVMRSPVWR